MTPRFFLCGHFCYDSSPITVPQLPLSGVPAPSSKSRGVRLFLDVIPNASAPLFSDEYHMLCLFPLPRAALANIPIRIRPRFLSCSCVMEETLRGFFSHRPPHHGVFSPITLRHKEKTSFFFKNVEDSSLSPSATCNRSFPSRRFTSRLFPSFHHRSQRHDARCFPMKILFFLCNLYSSHPLSRADMLSLLLLMGLVWLLLARVGAFFFFCNRSRSGFFNRGRSRAFFPVRARSSFFFSKIFYGCLP